MTLATHIVVAGAAASPFLASPLLSFFVGLMSHYVIDAIPHWDWPLRSIEKDLLAAEHRTHFSRKTIAFDVIRAMLDTALGFLLLFFVFSSNMDLSRALSISAAALGGILPDALQFVHFFFKEKYLGFHQRFHDWAHAKKGIPQEKVLRGIALQLPVILFPLLFIFFLFGW